VKDCYEIVFDSERFTKAMESLDKIRKGQVDLTMESQKLF
jgi:hypothetical protein